MDIETSGRMQKVLSGILEDARNELYLNMRFLAVALFSLPPIVTDEAEGIGTDGRVLFAHPYILADLYEENRLLVNRVYLHSLMHCLFRHLFKRPRKNRELWHLSCDIAVESVIDGLNARCLRTGISVQRRNWYERLKRELPVLNAEGIYHVLSEYDFTPKSLELLKMAFRTDDHSRWPDIPEDEDEKLPEAAAILKNSWDDIGEKTQKQMDSFAAEEGEGEGELLSSLKAENRERADLRAFLRKFAVLKEEVRIDTDGFDYIYYTFGLNMYGNMPLVEYPEYRENVRIEDFVIVLDVSMSTRGELVRQFLRDTCSVLAESESYFRKVHIRILQCDDQVREDVRITRPLEFEQYMESFELKGGGGTDFRPAFEYVNNLVEKKQFSNLRGMLYFTDGLGTFPLRRPSWDTAFVFTDRQKDIPQVPPWAIRLILPSYPEEER